MALLSLGANPTMDARAAAVIMGAMDASSIEMFTMYPLHPNIFAILIARIGAMISLIVKDTVKGFISSFGNLNFSCKPTAISAKGTMVPARSSSELCKKLGK